MTEEKKAPSQKGGSISYETALELSQIAVTGTFDLSWAIQKFINQNHLPASVLGLLNLFDNCRAFPKGHSFDDRPNFGTALHPSIDFGTEILVTYNTCFSKGTFNFPCLSSNFNNPKGETLKAMVAQMFETIDQNPTAAYIALPKEADSELRKKLRSALEIRLASARMLPFVQQVLGWNVEFKDVTSAQNVDYPLFNNLIEESKKFKTQEDPPIYNPEYYYLQVLSYLMLYWKMVSDKSQLPLDKVIGDIKVNEATYEIMKGAVVADLELFKPFVGEAIIGYIMKGEEFRLLFQIPLQVASSVSEGAAPKSDVTLENVKRPDAVKTTIQNVVKGTPEALEGKQLIEEQKKAAVLKEQTEEEARKEAEKMKGDLEKRVKIENELVALINKLELEFSDIAGEESEAVIKKWDAGKRYLFVKEYNSKMGEFKKFENLKPAECSDKSKELVNKLKTLKPQLKAINNILSTQKKTMELMIKKVKEDIKKMREDMKKDKRKTSSSRKKILDEYSNQFTGLSKVIFFPYSDELNGQNGEFIGQRNKFQKELKSLEVETSNLMKTEINAKINEINSSLLDVERALKLQSSNEMLVEVDRFSKQLTGLLKITFDPFNDELKKTNDEFIGVRNEFSAKLDLLKDTIPSMIKTEIDAKIGEINDAFLAMDQALKLQSSGEVQAEFDRFSEMLTELLKVSFNAFNDELKKKNEEFIRLRNEFPTKLESFKSKITSLMKEEDLVRIIQARKDSLEVLDEKLSSALESKSINPESESFFFGDFSELDHFEVEPLGSRSKDELKKLGEHQITVRERVLNVQQMIEPAIRSRFENKTNHCGLLTRVFKSFFDSISILSEEEVELNEELIYLDQKMNSLRKDQSSISVESLSGCGFSWVNLVNMKTRLRGIYAKRLIILKRMGEILSEFNDLDDKSVSSIESEFTKLKLANPVVAFDYKLQDKYNKEVLILQNNLEKPLSEFLLKFPLCQTAESLPDRFEAEQKKHTDSINKLKGVFNELFASIDLNLKPLDKIRSIITFLDPYVDPAPKSPRAHFRDRICFGLFA